MVHYTELTDRQEAFVDRVESASKDELKEMFGDSLTKARAHKAVDGEISVRLSLTDDGQIDSVSHTVLQRGSYISPDSPSGDHRFGVPTDPFVGYEDIRTQILRQTGRA